ncbi:MAG TPA: EAL domain-containing protein, partial [Arenimonas sp.]|nr:EAL domain-containing protein [Arenimonas sp.]
GSEMNGGAELVARDGRLYFGGVAGVTWFDPRTLPRNERVPEVRISRVSVGGRDLNAGLAPPPAQLQLDYAHGGVAVEFAVLDYHQPEKNRFRYRLLGDGRGEWIESERNRVDLVSLQPGSYSLEVQGGNSDGVWSVQPARLSLLVHAPWWRSGWAYALYALAALVGIGGYLLLQRRALRRERAFNLELSRAQSLADANYQLAQRYSQFDELTQLPNRSSLLDALARYQRVSQGKGQMLALLLFNLDRFQRVNDSIGHALGDRVLRGTAERLQAAIRGDDLLARTGSDELALIALGGIEDDWLDGLLARMSAAISEPHAVQDPPLSMTASIGVAVADSAALTPGDLYARADIAMHHAKDDGGNCARRYRDGMREKQRERLGLEGRMRRALDAGEFVPYYQPLVNLRGNRLAGYEALVRWLPPDASPVYPDQFIPVAEETGLIVELGAFMLEAVCKQLAEWQRFDIQVAVNVSMHQLRAGGLVDAVAAALKTHGVPPACLKIEVTETAMMENVGETIGQLHALRELGISLSIDDFGTGFSSLSHLQMLPASELKIDRSFVQGLGVGEHNRKIVRSMVRLAHELKLRVVAEGIEDELALAYLREIGCDIGQGYLFDRPLPAAQASAWLQREATAVGDA